MYERCGMLPGGVIATYMIRDLEHRLPQSHLGESQQRNGDEGAAGDQDRKLQRRQQRKERRQQRTDF